jgi:hypothetical protein
MDGRPIRLSKNDISCDTKPPRPFWPWGSEAFGLPTAARTEWVRRFYVLCCA